MIWGGIPDSRSLGVVLKIGNFTKNFSTFFHYYVPFPHLLHIELNEIFPIIDNILLFIGKQFSINVRQVNAFCCVILEKNLITMKFMRKQIKR